MSWGGFDPGTCGLSIWRCTNEAISNHNKKYFKLLTINTHSSVKSRLQFPEELLFARYTRRKIFISTMHLKLRFKSI